MINLNKSINNEIYLTCSIDTELTDLSNNYQLILTNEQDYNEYILNLLNISTINRYDKFIITIDDIKSIPEGNYKYEIFNDTYSDILLEIGKCDIISNQIKKTEIDNITIKKISL